MGEGLGRFAGWWVSFGDVWVNGGLGEFWGFAGEWVKAWVSFGVSWVSFGDLWVSFWDLWVKGQTPPSRPAQHGPPVVHIPPPLCLGEGGTWLIQAETISPDV